MADDILYLTELLGLSVFDLKGKKSEHCATPLLCP